ncbi:MAG: SAM-dependent methyltransferase [Armatimonadota bacterium]
MITVVGLGPLKTGNISMGAYGAIRSAPIVFVRTEKHPAVDQLKADGVRFSSFDRFYESSQTFSEVYTKIAAEIIRIAEAEGDVVYAVPGHPLAGETAVSLLIDEARRKQIPLKIVGSESFIEASLEAAGCGFDEGLMVVDALSMSKVSPVPAVPNLIYQVYDKSIASDVKLALMEAYPDEFPVTVIRGAGSPEESVERVPLHRLDRCRCDHLTTVYVPPLKDKENE